jgi:hypothetical protein
LPEVGGSVGKMYGYVSAGRYEVSDFESYDATTDTWTLKKEIFCRRNCAPRYDETKRFG